MRVQLTNGRTHDDRGVIALLVALLAVVLIGVVAFVADFGMAYSNQRTLQNAADAAALAAGQRVLQDSVPGQTCAQMITDTTHAQNDAKAAFGENAGSGSTLVGNSVSIKCDDPILPDRVVVSADGSVDSPSFFGRFFGYDRYHLEKPAKAVVGPAGTIVGIRPFALCDALGAASAVPNSYVTVDFQNADQGCGSATGNFGTLDMRNAYTPPAGPSVNGCPGNLVNDWISNGYSGAVPASSPLYVRGEPGIPAQNFEPDFTAILGQPIVIPTYDLLTGNGCNNAVYRITGFVEAKVCGFKLNPSGTSRVTAACFSAPDAPTDTHDRFVQLQFTRFIALGSLDLTCSIAAACDGGVEVLKLAN